MRSLLQSRYLNNREIAMILNISMNTVKLHTIKLMRKLGTVNRTHTAYIIGSMKNKANIISPSIKISANLK